MHARFKNMHARFNEHFKTGLIRSWNVHEKISLIGKKKEGFPRSTFLEH